MQQVKADEYTVELNPSQYEIYTSEAFELFFIGGLGSGKSFTIGVWSEARLTLPGTVGLIAAPSGDVVRSSTLPAVIKAWQMMGIEENRDFVVNIRPPDSWGIKPFSPLHQKNIITFRWGSYIMVGGLDNFNKYRGTEFDWIAVDEMRDVKEEARVVLIGRLRGRAFMEAGRKHQMLWATTPPEDFDFLEKCLESPSAHHTIAHTKENEDNLREGYVQDLRETYDDITAQREIEGQLVNANARPFAYKFGDHHLYDLGTVEVYAKQPLWISFDFNVEPMTCVIGQKGYGWANVIDEIDLTGSPEDVCDEILHRYPGFTYLITGGHDGYHRLKVRGNPSPFKHICETLGVAYPDDVFARKSGMVIKGSKGARAMLNSILQHHPTLRIDRKCEGLIKDLRKARVDHTGELDKSRSKKEKYLDKLDCFRYLLETWFVGWFDNPGQYF